MTISIVTPAAGPCPVPSPGIFQATGQNDTGDDVCGWLLDTDSNSAFVSDVETLALDGGGILWNWTLNFTTDNTIAVGHNLILYVYDAETGGDGDSEGLTQTAGVAFGAAGPVAGAAPAAGVGVGAVAPGVVQDITINATLRPAGAVKGSVFLAMRKANGALAVLHHHLPPSTQANRPVIFRTIDVGYWDSIHAIVVVKRHKGTRAVARVK